MSNDWQAEQRPTSFVSDVGPFFVPDAVNEELDGSSLARLRAGLRKVVDSVAIYATLGSTTANSTTSDGTRPV
jgi:hypothetical protein